MNNMHKTLRRPGLLATAAFALGAVVTLGAQGAPKIRALTEPWPEIVKVDDIEILRVLKNVYMLVGAGANVTVNIGDEGVVMVDAGAAGNSAKLQHAIRSLTRKPLRFLVNSAPDADKVGGNAEMVTWASSGKGAEEGIAQRGQNPASPNLGALLIAHENTFNRMVEGSKDVPAVKGDGLPSSTFFTPRKDLNANDEAFQIFFEPKAHTDGDVIVFFRGSDVIHAGEIFRTDQFPLVDVARGGSINGLLAGLNQVLDLAIPARNQMGGTRIVPAYGRIANEADVLEYRDMLTIIRDRVQALIVKKATLAQVQTAGVALEYDQYGKNPKWSTEMFVEAVYNSLNKKN